MKTRAVLFALICIFFTKTLLAAEVKIRVREEENTLYYDVRCSNVPLGVVLGALSAAGEFFCNEHDCRHHDVGIGVLFPTKADVDFCDLDYVTSSELQNYEAMSPQELARFRGSVLETPVGIDIARKSLLDILHLIICVCNHALIVTDAKIIIVPCKYLGEIPFHTEFCLEGNDEICNDF